MDVGYQFKSIEPKKTNHLFGNTCLIFLTNILIFYIYISYECYTKIKHECVSDTTTRLLKKSVHNINTLLFNKSI